MPLLTQIIRSEAAWDYRKPCLPQQMTRIFFFCYNYKYLSGSLLIFSSSVVTWFTFRTAVIVMGIPRKYYSNILLLCSLVGQIWVWEKDWVVFLSHWTSHEKSKLFLIILHLGWFKMAICGKNATYILIACWLPSSIISATQWSKIYHNYYTFLFGYSNAHIAGGLKANLEVCTHRQLRLSAQFCFLSSLRIPFYEYKLFKRTSLDLQVQISIPIGDRMLTLAQHTSLEACIKASVSTFLGKMFTELMKPHSSLFIVEHFHTCFIVFIILFLLCEPP